MTDTTHAIKLGISACLLGEQVRFDGGHKHHDFINASLSRYFSFVPFCPEVAIGLGIPRQPIRLIATGTEVRAVGTRQATLDVTAPLRDYASQTAAQLEDISGYIFKKGSPSCGMERVKVYHGNGMPQAQGRGIYADELMRRLPLLPVEEEGRLMDPLLRENFIERVFIYHRWQQLNREPVSPAKLVAFHTELKYTLLSRGQPVYRELGRLVARAGNRGEDFEALCREYIALLMGALAKPAKRGHHANVLMHMMGYLKKQLATQDKAEMLTHIENYRRGIVPLVVPLTLLNHFLRKYPDRYLQRQRYLLPYPEQLSLRNSI